MTTLSLDRKKELLKGHFLLRHLRDWDLERLARHSRILNAKAGTVIFKKHDPGDSMIVIISGRVMIGSKSAEGREILFNIMSTGEVFGEIAFLDEESRSADAKALEDTTYLVLERRYFLPFLEENPKVAVELMIVLCKRLRNATGQIEDTAFFELSTRLAKKLIAFAEHYGSIHEHGSRIELPLSQSDLGAMLNATRESINRQLRSWVKSGLIEMEDGSIIVVDIKRLTEVAEDA